MEFYVPESMLSTVKELILNTGSIDQGEEKQYWFDIWDSMNESQQERFISILQEEKDKLEVLQLKYEESIKHLHTEFTCKQDVIDFIKS